MLLFVVAKMVTLLLTSLFVITLLAIAIYFWQQPASSNKSEVLPPSPGRALFHEGTPAGIAQAAVDAQALKADKAGQLRNGLLDRARSGDKTTLQEAQAEDALLYDEVLDALVAGAESDAALLSLVSYITRNNVRVNRNLAERFIASCTGNLDRGRVAKMLHVAALSDDAAVYQKGVETALQTWRKGTLSEISARELRAILDGEFWILSSPTRSSGAGFLLKRALASARSELDAAHRE